MSRTATLENATTYDAAHLTACIAAIREDAVVGDSTCSGIAETMDDSELAEALQADKVFDPTAAVRWARDLELLVVENGTNFRQGEEDDPELVILREFREECEKPISVTRNAPHPCASQLLSCPVHAPNRSRNGWENV